MKNNTSSMLKKCLLKDMQKKINEINLKELTFSQLGEILSDIFNEVYHQLKPIRDEMNKKYLKIKEGKQNLKQAS